MLQLVHATLWYSNTLVLNDITFSVEKGEFVALLGSNGSGKTTLLRAIAGVQKLTEGHIFIENINIRTLSAKQRALKIATVAQRPPIPYGMTVWDFVVLGRYPHLGFLGFLGKNDYAIVEKALADTETLHFRNRYLTELSGGERQRVFLAQSLAKQSPLLLLDELGAGLDYRSHCTLFSYLKNLTVLGYTVVCVMHDTTLAQTFATRLLGILHGSVCFDGSPSAVCTEENLSKLYEIPIACIQIPGTARMLAYPKICMDT